MIVVADTSPINYLVLIGHDDLLPKLFVKILIPGAVAEELDRAKSPRAVRAWISHPPSAIQIVPDVQVPASLMHLDPGERESLALAESVHADRLLLDDSGARREAEARGFTVTGTLGILAIAARDRLIDLNDAYNKLKKTSFHAPESLFHRILAQHEQDRTTLD